MFPHGLDGIQVFLGDVVIDDEVNAGNDQLIHHSDALCHRVAIVCLKERSCFGVQLLHTEERVKKRLRKRTTTLEEPNKWFPNLTARWNCLWTLPRPHTLMRLLCR